MVEDGTVEMPLQWWRSLGAHMTFEEEVDQVMSRSIAERAVMPSAAPAAAAVRRPSSSSDDTSTAQSSRSSAAESDDGDDAGVSTGSCIKPLGLPSMSSSSSSASLLSARAASHQWCEASRFSRSAVAVRHSCQCQ